jgi:hypothetical protein
MNTTIANRSTAAKCCMVAKHPGDVKSTTTTTTKASTYQIAADRFVF